MTMFYLAIGPMSWGRGNTPEEAIRNWRGEIPWIYIKKGVNAVKCDVYECPKRSKAVVTGMGDISYDRRYPIAHVRCGSAKAPPRYRD